MKIKNYIINILRGLHVWAHCTVAELGVAMSVYGFYLTSKDNGYLAVLTFVSSLVMLYLGINGFTMIGREFFPKKCKCGGKCHKHDATTEEME